MQMFLDRPQLLGYTGMIKPSTASGSGHQTVVYQTTFLELKDDVMAMVRS
jgi:hypothetical protein